MTDEPRSSGWAVRVPATSANLGPGFDSLGIAVARHLRAEVVARRDERVTTVGEGEGDVPTGDDNLVWRSARTFAEEHGVDLPDVSLVVRNAIPLERGLGSSSSAIVAGLVLGRCLTGVEVGDRALVDLADRIEGHPDNVAPAILGGFVACTRGGAGELVVRRAQPVASARVLVAVPPTRQNTKEARGVLPDALDRGDVALQAGRSAHVTGAFVGAWPVDGDAVGDLLHEPARFGVMDGTRTVVDAWRRLGLQAWLSGAGPTAAALVPATGDDDRVAEARTAARDAGFVADVLDPDLAGVVVCPPDGCGVSGRISGVDVCSTCPRQSLG